MEALIQEDSPIVKGKRTKRQRLHLSSISESTNDPEEEEMANCLILLAQGDHKPDPFFTEEPAAAVKINSLRFAEAPTTTIGRAGIDVYECKTCGKCFSTYQALGGHRASHKKPKLLIPSAPAEETKTVVMCEDSIRLCMNSFALPLAAKARLHECSICAAAFSTGQALGGHMRRHRPASLNEPPKRKGKPIRLSLDLNLPAPAEDEQPSSPIPAIKMPPFKTPILLLTSSLLNFHH